MNTTFWNQNKVFILGLLGAVSVVLQSFLGQKEINTPALGLAVGLAILAYLAKEWRGQGLSIVGIVGTASGTIYDLYQTGHFSWQQAGLMFTIAIISSASPDPKSRGYENTDVIKQAKAEGEVINPASLTTKPKETSPTNIQ